MTRATRFCQASLNRGPAQSNNGFHRLHIFGTDLHAEVAACAVPDAGGFLKRCQTRASIVFALPCICDKSVGLGQGGRSEKIPIGLMRGTSRHTSAALNTGIDIVKGSGIGGEKFSFP